MKTSALIFNGVEFRREEFFLKADNTFPAGKLTVILGPSGSGKTTLLDLAAGFLKPDKGSIMEGNLDVTMLSPEKRQVGVVFQDHALFPHLSVRDNVAYGPRARGMGRRQAGMAADRYLEMTRISRYAKKKPSSLSGGEKQRVSLARALAIKPKILLLDEPFSSLDASLRRDMRNEVRNIQRETGITAVLVTHDQEEALSLADFLAVMKDGEITQMGSPADLWTFPENLFTALFIGRSTRLKIRKISSLKDNLYTVETAAGSIRVEHKGTIPDLPATLIIRPENLRVSGSGDIRGTVKEAEYTGDQWKIYLSVPGDSSDLIEFNCPGAAPPSIGESVTLMHQPGSVRILPGVMNDPGIRLGIS
ncbi:MAG: polyamine ABC transporter ATP-binding protein [Spirochaetes bacterium]|nr:MAG: polyamine ABC transporter ATP-binding protein [Spirochaetota bacterium]RKX81095.1 MAG: polyamine ABC transporter ATP-binding protein [Spirochaetota bacterium]RKX88891.1 MAG: polyamine ABC transporter ATP-binding protein [Spirochaetota bacterium]